MRNFGAAPRSQAHLSIRNGDGDVDQGSVPWAMSRPSGAVDDPVAIAIAIAIAVFEQEMTIKAAL
jgi:hypothetical protein